MSKAVEHAFLHSLFKKKVKKLSMYLYVKDATGGVSGEHS